MIERIDFTKIKINLPITIKRWINIKKSELKGCSVIFMT